MDTDNFAARILLGNALFRQDKKTEASIVLRRALDLAKNEREKRLARGLLRQISQLQRFKLNGTFGFVPSSNVGKVISEEKVDLIFGVATITSEDPTTGVGMFGGLNATYEHPCPASFLIISHLIRMIVCLKTNNSMSKHAAIRHAFYSNL